jgi:hypothetical protein
MKRVLVRGDTNQGHDKIDFMARTIQQIITEIKAAYVTQRASAGLPVDDPANWSIYSYKALWCGIVALAIWTRDKLDDLLRKEIDEKIAALKPHTERWYVSAVKKFRYGQDLIEESDQYDDTDLSPEDIAASMIVAQAAVAEQTRGIRIKVAKLAGGELAPLLEPEMEALLEYVRQVKDAGVKIILTTGPADSLKMKLYIKYNPLVLNALGQRIDGTDNEPVQNAVKTYLKNLPFNGRFELDKLVNELQAVEGADAAYVVEATARYGVLPYAGFANYLYIPDAGYLRLYDPADLIIEFVPNV